MRSFLRFVIDKPVATAIMAVVMVFAGVYSLKHMPVDLFPNLDVPVVNIISHYTGAAPEDIELLVSRPVEDEMRSIPGVKRVASISAQGVSRISVEFSWGTTVRDARQLIQARLARLAGTLPPGVSPRLESIGTTLQEVAGYVIYGGGNPVALRNIIRHDIAGRLMSVDGVSSVEVLGGDRRAFNVKISPDTLARFHLSLGDITAFLKKDNVARVSGYLTRSGREYLLRASARLKTLDDIRSIPVAGDGKKPVLLGSIADVHEGRVPRHYSVRGDGVPAVAVLVRKQPGASTIRVVRGVDRELAGLGSTLPPGNVIKKFYDQSEIISEARSEILYDLLIGALLAVFVLYFFLGSIGSTLIVTVTIPVTLLATVAVMGWMGLSLNIITMTALVLAIGMIVDDSIVVAENIFRHAGISTGPVEAATEGAVEIAGPDASGTFTTVAVFIPLILVTGIGAVFLRPFGLTIGTALVVSLVLSLTLVPVLFSRRVFVSTVQRSSPGKVTLAFLEKNLIKAMRFSFRHKAPVLALAVAFLFLAGLAALLGRAALLPPIDEGAILIEYVMPPGTSLAESDRIGDALNKIAMAEPDASAVYRRTGSPSKGYQIEGVNMGELMIKLKEKKERSRSAARITETFKKAFSKFKGVVFLYHQPTQEKIDESFSGIPAFFGVTIYGTDMKELISLADRVEGVLIKDRAISNVVNNTKVNSSEIDVRVNRAGLARYGASVEDVMLTLKAVRTGIEATRIVREKEDVTVLVTMDIEKPLLVEKLRHLPVVSRKGEIIPLVKVADVRVAHVPAAITRLNGQREITLLVEAGGSITSLVKRLKEAFQSIKLPAGYSIDFTGQYRVLLTMAVEMAFTVMAAVILIYLIMVMQFRTYLQPLMILLTIPFSLVGGLVALFVTNQGVDVSVGMGAVTLVGIAVNNAIVLIDYANRRRAAGAGLEDSLLQAASVRLRPILLTSFTTIFALLPVAIGVSTGSGVFRPFAITVIGGLVSGVFATLIIVPTLVVSFTRS